MPTDDMNTLTTTDDDVPLLDRNLYRTIKKMDRTNHIHLENVRYLLNRLP